MVFQIPTLVFALGVQGELVRPHHSIDSARKASQNFQLEHHHAAIPPLLLNNRLPHPRPSDCHPSPSVAVRHVAGLFPEPCVQPHVYQNALSVIGCNEEDVASLPHY
jgi:hypothetical protein